MKILFTLCIFFIFSFPVKAQHIKFEEYELANGLHVILHEAHEAPAVAITVMYHVGSKNEIPTRTGFAHFFEHLLFEGTENIKRGEYSKIVENNGGESNANTTQDRTFFYEIFPSNQLELGLWLESERMFHPTISTPGILTQKEVIKEEKRQSIDNQPYGRFDKEIFKNLFTTHHYKWQPIGSMKDIDSARIDEFKHFFDQYYGPNNAVLTITGDINIQQVRRFIDAYFAPIPRKAKPYASKIEEAPILKSIIDTTYDQNIQIPAIATAYRIKGMNSRDSKVLKIISSILSEGQSSRLFKKMIDEKKDALQIMAYQTSLEDYGVYVIGATPNENVSLERLLNDIDEEIKKLKTDLISEAEFTKAQNQFENSYLSKNTYLVGIAENLSNAYLFSKSTNNINEELQETRSITREEIRLVANKYLNATERVLLYYLPIKKAPAIN